MHSLAKKGHKILMYICRSQYSAFVEDLFLEEVMQGEPTQVRPPWINKLFQVVMIKS